MAKKKRIPETFDNQPLSIGKEETLFLYKLLLYVEEAKRKKEFAGFSVKNKYVREYLQTKGISLVQCRKPQKHDEKNTIKFKVSKSLCWDLLVRIRNAFAHGTLTKNDNCYLLTDVYKKECTMYGNLSSSLLCGLIDVITTNRKNNNSN